MFRSLTRALPALGFVFSIALSLPAAAQVDINSADQAELEELPGIGEKIAEAIVRDREDNGPYASLEELARVPGVSSGLIARLEGKASAGGGGYGGGSESVVVREGEQVSGDVVKKVLRKYAGEPTITELQKAVLDYARAHPDVVDSWRWRARVAGALPQLDVDGQYTLDDDTRTVQSTDATTGAVTVEDDDVGYRVIGGARWDLDRLLFDRNEMAASRELVRLASLRDRILDEATRRYFERRRLQVDMELNPPRDLPTRVRKELRVQELTADLDSLTGGWFSKKLEDAGRSAY